MIQNDPDYDFKCPECKREFVMFDQCGTGTTWTLLRCRDCKKYTAVGWTGGFIPKEVNDEYFKIQL